MNPYLQMVIAGAFLLWSVAGCFGLRQDIRTGATTSGTGRYSRVVPVSRSDAPSRFWTCITINAVCIAVIFGIGIWALADAWRSSR